mmetsp:Transcript_49370/g.115516  ORF Transcript_49370/g.115516 Transcript_49370/m.115516 type:complete len:199 (+) Transcript_49370:108-704(+)
MRSHTGERLACGVPSCDFKTAWSAQMYNHRKKKRHQGALVLLPPSTALQKLPPGVNASAEREALCEPPSEEEGGELEDAISEPDLETELSAAKEEVALAQRKLKKNKHALWRENECSVSLRAELAAAQAVVKVEPVLAKAGEMEAMAAAHARELSSVLARLDAAELRVVAMEAREASNAVDARAVAAQTLADAAGAGQ